MSNTLFRRIIFCLTIFTATALLTSCYKHSNAILSSNCKINVISREEGSGTRDAFVSTLQITDDAGCDNTILSAEQNASTAVVLMTVQNDPAAIGYISFSSLNPSVTPVLINGVAPSVENIQNKSYKLARPFNLVYKNESSTIAKDFLKFIYSKQGQELVQTSGYVPIEPTNLYTSSNSSGTVKISGSTSVAPLIKLLAERYEQINPNARILVSEGGTSTGINNVQTDICDIAMASRELKDSELQLGLISITIATDGIAVITNPNNPYGISLTHSQIRDIYTGKITHWTLEN